jgi:hypothetical protein
MLTQNGKSFHLVITSTAGSQENLGAPLGMPLPKSVTKPNPSAQLPAGLSGLFPPPPPTLSPSARSNEL